MMHLRPDDDDGRPGNTDTHEFGRIVLLNGPPSVGKTSLAQALQATLTEPWFHRSLDDFRGGYCDRFWNDDDGTLFDRVMAGYLGAISEMARAGNDVIAESVISSSRRELYASTLQNLPVILIGVHCSLAEALRRERTRTDRRNGPIELPADAFAAVHSEIIYDLEVDTSSCSPDDLALELVDRIQDIIPGTLSHHLVEFDENEVP
ncbi:MAG: phosphotransferase-like protein [Acidimicrobiales bacterium]